MSFTSWQAQSRSAASFSRPPLRILGLSAFGHDSAAALVEDGVVRAAAQEERFSRRKADGGFPAQAIRAVLECAGVPLGAVDRVAFHGAAIAARRLVVDGLAALEPAAPWRDRIAFLPHQLSHAASAFYPSPFEGAAVLTIDGAGERSATSLAVGQGASLRMLEEAPWPHAIALLYSAVTQFAGFRPEGGEYKLMGLAPYGEPRFLRTLRDQVAQVHDDGRITLDLSCFDLAGFAEGRRLASPRFEALFGGPPRARESALTAREMDLAASVQALTEEVVLKLARHARRVSGERRLCLAGSVALNCVANGRLQHARIFDELWIQPAAGDAGGALGAALWLAHGQGQGEGEGEGGLPRVPARPDGMQGALLGPAYAQADIEARLAAAGARFRVLGDAALLDACAAALTRGEALGWHQGRMEFGPRALGARSILADPRSAAMQRTLNLKVKFRESFRPFAPAVLAEEAGRWFELEGASPYMLLVADVHPSVRRGLGAEEAALTGLAKLGVVRSAIPAVTHVDLSARVQTVDAGTHPRFHALLARFAALTGCPVLVNTSFNVRGEPIVATPEDAFRCFMGSGIEWLAVGNCLLRKAEQDAAPPCDHVAAFPPD